MGPLASTEFLNTIYRLSLERIGKDGKEQDMARVILVSDPSVPDRTEAIVTRRDKPQQFVGGGRARHAPPLQDIHGLCLTWPEQPKPDGDHLKRFTAARLRARTAR